VSLGKIIRQRREERKLTQDQVAERVGISKPYLSGIETDRVKNPPSDGVLERLEQALGFGDDDLRKMAHLARTPPDVRQENERLAAEVEKLRAMISRASAAGGGEAVLAEIAGRLKAMTAAAGAPPTISAGRAVPIINRVAAGYPHHFTDLDYPPSIADQYVRCPDVHDPQAFAARVVGDSMSPKYRPGDLVIFAPNAPVRDGDDCFVRFASDHSTTFKRFGAADGGRVRLEPLNDAYEAEEYGREDIDGLWPAVMRVEALR